MARNPEEKSVLSRYDEENETAWHPLKKRRITVSSDNLSERLSLLRLKILTTYAEQAELVC